MVLYNKTPTLLYSFPPKAWAAYVKSPEEKQIVGATAKKLNEVIPILIK